jgi:hypothetical protein
LAVGTPTEADSGFDVAGSRNERAPIVGLALIDIFVLKGLSSGFTNGLATVRFSILSKTSWSLVCF